MSAGCEYLNDLLEPCGCKKLTSISFVSGRDRRVWKTHANHQYWLYYLAVTQPVIAEKVFLPLSTHLAPATTTFLQADTQSSLFLCSTCPNHFNLSCLTTSATLSTPKRLYKSTLRFLSFSDTPHIHLTIIRSILSRLCRFAFFIAQVSVPYVNTLWTQAVYIFPFMPYDAPRVVRIGDWT